MPADTRSVLISGVIIGASALENYADVCVCDFCLFIWERRFFSRCAEYSMSYFRIVAVSVYITGFNRKLYNIRGNIYSGELLSHGKGILGSAELFRTE